MRHSQDATRRRWASAGLIAAVAIVLTGCFGAPQRPDGGQSTASAQAAVASLPGVTAASVSSDPRVSGLGTIYPVSVTITLKPGYRVVDGAALADFLVRSGWSLNDIHQPTEGLSISVFVPEGNDFNIGAYADDWDASTSAPSPSPGEDTLTSFTIVFPSSGSEGSELEGKIGPWPCDPPTVPDGVIVPE